MASQQPSPMRNFNPVELGGLESRAWVTYYRHEWLAFLRAAIGMVRVGFGMGPLRTVRGAWYVLRANQVWAPVPNNDPDKARKLMRKFYVLVARTHDESIDVDEAARREVEWWRVHREHQRERPDSSREPLIAALGSLYSHVYRTTPEAVRQAAAERSEAMRYSDQWVNEGCDIDSPLVAQERAALVRSYAALLAAVHRVPAAPAPVT